MIYICCLSVLIGEHLLQIGTLLYVRVVKANNSMNPELSCVDGTMFLLNLSAACFPFLTQQKSSYDAFI